MRRVIPALAALILAAPAAALDLKETPVLEHSVADGSLPPVAERLPDEPLVADLAARGREPGRHGGEIRTIFSRAKDVRYMVVYGYARLVGYNLDYELEPDILRDIEVEDGRVFTLHLREGHKWSDGAPFTAENFRYWWEDVANNADLYPSGPPRLMMVEGELPEFEVIDETTIRYTWPAPNPRFMPALAEARPPFIYRPSHFMKDFHIDYARRETLDEMMAETSSRNWAQLHNKLDNMYKFDNPDLPTLQPWMNMSDKNSSRYLLRRNPFFHRVDPEGRQLPYVDSVEITISAPGLIPAKVNRGEADMQARGLSFSDAPVLKKGEETGGYTTYLWTTGAGSDIALYPNLTYNDEVWREVFRDVRFRRALSLAINRKAINKSLYFGMAEPRAVAALEKSPFYKEAHAKSYAEYDPKRARDLLDEMGLEQTPSGTRTLPDGRPVEVVVETAGERQEVSDALELVREMWEEVGVEMIFRPLNRDILRNRAYAGESMMPVWYGWNNGIPTAEAAPEALAPVDQTNFSWPKWGQHFQTKGDAGYAPDMPAPKRLMELFKAWTSAESEKKQAEIWREMLEIHAENVFSIGLVAAAPQPVIFANTLRNIPEEGVYAWEPGAHLGVYRIDEFFYAE